MDSEKGFFRLIWEDKNIRAAVVVAAVVVIMWELLN